MHPSTVSTPVEFPSRPGAALLGASRRRGQARGLSSGSAAAYAAQVDAGALGLVALGGGLGAVGRHAIASAVRAWSPWPAYVGVLIANLLGCVFIAFGAARLGGTPWAPLVVTGFCGALTTFSTFSLDNVILAVERKWRELAINVVASLLLGVGLTYGLVSWWAR